MATASSRRARASRSASSCSSRPGSRLRRRARRRSGTPATRAIPSPPPSTLAKERESRNLMRSSFAALVLPAAALALASCAQSPEVDHPSLGDVDVPAQWAALELLDEKERAEGSYEASPWWRRFNRPDLDGIIARVLERNHDLRAAAERVFAAAAQARIAGADAAPQIAAVFDASRTRQNFIGLPIPGASGGVLSTHFTSLGVALDLTWELDLWGRIRAGRSAALADLEATYADVEAARLSLVGQA